MIYAKCVNGNQELIKMNRNKSFDQNPTLYLIATPIGNLKEFSPRALEVINQCDFLASEDTRNTANLLKHFGIEKKIISLREHNENEASEYVCKKILEGQTVGYMSDAGYPGISDPGYLLVKQAIKYHINVSTVSGSSAFINALVASGLNTDHFYFYGFLSPKEKEAKETLLSLSNRHETLIFYESPHRIKKTMDLLIELFPHRDIVLARELTKLNEEYIRAKVEEFKDFDYESIKGEMVIILSGNIEENEISDEQIKNKISYLLNLGVSKKIAITIIKDEYQINKNRVYKLAEEVEGQ